MTACSIRSVVAARSAVPFTGSPREASRAGDKMAEWTFRSSAKSEAAFVRLYGFASSMLCCPRRRACYRHRMRGRSKSGGGEGVHRVRTRGKFPARTLPCLKYIYLPQ